MGSVSRLPRYRDLPGPTASRPAGAAWGLFGESDEVGTLNLLTPDLVRRAASLVRWGTVFPLNWRMDLPAPPLLGRGAVRRVEKDLGPGTDDYYDDFYPQASSQWDALRHVGHPTYGYYNGFPLEDPRDLGAPHLGIDQWAVRGIAGRFVLADVDRYRSLRGHPFRHGERAPVTVAELDGVLAAQQVTLDHGDILLLRFGWITWYGQLDVAQREMLSMARMFPAPGLAAEERTAEWLWDHAVAAVASDTPALEAMPFDRSSVEGFLHYRLVVFLGMAVGEMFDLDALADDCAANHVYEGLFVSAPLNYPGGSGSPANALAIK
jgi:kynurenine formamidase